MLGGFVQAGSASLDTTHLRFTTRVNVAVVVSPEGAEVLLWLATEVHVLTLKSMLRACLFNSILHCSLKDVDFYICECLEFNAISGDTCFADFLPKSLCQVFLVT